MPWMREGGKCVEVVDTVEVGEERVSTGAPWPWGRARTMDAKRTRRRTFLAKVKMGKARMLWFLSMVDAKMARLALFQNLREDPSNVGRYGPYTRS